MVRQRWLFANTLPDLVNLIYYHLLRQQWYKASLALQWMEMQVIARFHVNWPFAPLPEITS
jgi:hypothetical protein